MTKFGSASASRHSFLLPRIPRIPRLNSFFSVPLLPHRNLYLPKSAPGVSTPLLCPSTSLNSSTATTPYKIIGACYEVYREKGCGFLEPVYQECMEIELRLQGIPYVSQMPLALEYKGTALQCTYVPDFICYSAIIVELKAVKELAPEHRAQVQNYLKATGKRVGLLVNFGHYPKVELERIVNTRGRIAPR